MLGFYALGEAPNGTDTDELSVPRRTRKRGWIYGHVPKRSWKYGRRK